MNTETIFLLLWLLALIMSLSWIVSEYRVAKLRRYILDKQFATDYELWRKKQDFKV